MEKLNVLIIREIILLFTVTKCINYVALPFYLKCFMRLFSIKYFQVLHNIKPI